MKRTMIRIAFLAFVAVLSANISTAQISIGAKGGLNLSNLNGLSIPDVETEALFGFHVGGYVAFNLGKNFALQPELVYSTQGVKLKDDANNEEDLKLNYFNIPVMARFYTNGGLFLEAGPQFGFKVNDVSLDGTDVDEAFKSSDFSLGAGLGFMGKSQGFGVGLRYNVGISKTADADAGAIEDADFKNGVFQLSLYARIFGGGKLKK
jgi:hypothetical protein